MAPFGFKGDPPDVPYSDSDVTGQRFNIDLVQNLRIPIADAVYIVYAVLGEYRSNVLTLSVKIE